VETVLMPMVGRIVTLRVRDGDAVTPGQVLAVFESMKMEIPLVAPAAGTVSNLRIAAGQVVPGDAAVCDIA
jgi:biotin carboxyl carrier protein